MLDIISKLPNVALFENFSESDIEKAFQSLYGKVFYFDKGEYLFLAGDNIDKIGVLLEGSLTILKDDISGNLNVLHKLKPFEIFGEAFSFINNNISVVHVMASEKSKIIYLDYKKFISHYSGNKDIQSKLIFNLLKVVSNKLVFLNKKVEILSKHSIREKLIAYFETLMLDSGKKEFTIPYGRTELAAYLGVNRSALSREISNMISDNILFCNGNVYYYLL